MKEYKKIFETFYMGNNELEEIWMFAVKINGDHTYMLLQHGSEESTRNKYDEFYEKLKYDNTGIDPSEDLYLFDATDFDEIEINKCLKDSVYVTTLIEADKFYKNNKHIYG